MADKISVIIPVYKVEAYLQRGLESVINQTYRALEIILVDDGSPDNSGRICDEYAAKDERIRVIHKKNGGAPAARNDALKIATGEWIAYVDPDDWIESEAFEHALSIAQRDQSDIVIFNTYVDEDDGKSTEMQAFAKNFTTDDREMIYQFQLSALNKNYNPQLHNWSQGFPWDKIYRASRMRECNVWWPEHLKANDDVVYTIYAFQAARKVSYINETFYHYCYNPGSIGRKYTPDRIQIEKDIYAELIHIRDMYQFDERFDQAMAARFVINTWLNCRRCFFHPDNKASLSEKLKVVREMLKEEPFLSAFANVERERQDKKYQFFLLPKKPSALWFYIVFRCDTVMKQFRRINQLGGVYYPEINDLISELFYVRGRLLDVSALA